LRKASKDQKPLSLLCQSHLNAQSAGNIPMDSTVLPIIASKDYEAFRTILKADIPDTFDKWLDLRAEWRAIHVERGGGSVIDIKLDPDQFSRYLLAARRAPELKSLILFAIGLANGDHY
jgi:hypothetical protein